MLLNIGQRPKIGGFKMKTTTRRWIRNDDVEFDGISWGTPAGQIMFVWFNERIEIYHDFTLVTSLSTKGYKEQYAINEARKVANKIIKESLI